MANTFLNQLKVIRQNSVEYYPVKKALWIIQDEETDDNPYSLSLNIEFGKGTVLGDDNSLLEKIPKWDFFDISLNEREIEKGFKIKITKEIGAFYYNTFQSTEDNIIEILERDGDNLLINFSAKTEDINSYDDIKPDNILHLTAWFKQRKIYKISNSQVDELTIIEDWHYKNHFKIFISGKEISIPLDIDCKFTNNDNIDIVGNFLNKIPQMYSEATKFLNENKESNEWILDFCAYHIDRIDMSEFLGKEIEVTIKMVIDLLEFNGISINSYNKEEDIHCSFYYNLPNLCSNESLIVYFNTKNEIYNTSYSGSRWPHTSRPALWYVKNDSRYFIK